MEKAPPTTPSSRPARMAVWMTVSVAVFVLAGSLALLLGFQHWADREERHAFEALAHADTAFLDRTPLPQSGQMAAQLGEVMGARVFFWHSATGSIVGKAGDSVDPAVLKMPVDGRVHRMPNGDWMIGRSYRGSSKVFFLRTPPDNIVALNRLDTWGALGIFWLLSLALGWWLARRVTGPLQTLAEALPFVGTDQPLPVIPVERRDEIGQLALTLQQTHQTLRDERERRRAAERLAILGRMATSLAHEVRNPVSAIRLHAQLLDGAPPEDAAASAKLIESEAARIESLVSQWMRYAKPGPVVMNEVDALALTEEAMNVMSAQAGHAKVELVKAWTLKPGDWLLKGDRARLMQVLCNVLLNAIQAMPAGGRATVRLEPGLIEIADEGRGFSVLALEKSGEPFFSEKEGGMGLGLSVSKEIIEAHGGQLTVANRPAGGALVTITLPMAKL